MDIKKPAMLMLGQRAEALARVINVDGSAEFQITRSLSSGFLIAQSQTIWLVVLG